MKSKNEDFFIILYYNMKNKSKKISKKYQKKIIKKRKTRKNIKLKRKGFIKAGKILGKGAKGTVMELTNLDNNDYDCFFGKNYLYETKYNNKEISSINLYNVNKDTLQIQVKYQDKTDFLNFLEKTYKTDTTRVVKFFKDELAFKDELIENTRVLSVYDVNAKNFITLEEGKDEDFSFSGFSISTSDKTSYFFISRKCNPNLFAYFGKYDIKDNPDVQTERKKKLVNFISDVLESLIIINGKNYYHNDLKPSNIVWCNKTSSENEKQIRLIDWGASKMVNITDINTLRYRGDPAFSSPMKMYLCYPLTSTINIPLQVLQYEILKGKKDWSYLTNEGYYASNLFDTETITTQNTENTETVETDVNAILDYNPELIKKDDYVGGDNGRIFSFFRKPTQLLSQAVPLPQIQKLPVSFTNSTTSKEFYICFKNLLKNQDVIYRTIKKKNSIKFDNYVATNYAKTFDIYMLGITIYNLAFQHKLVYNENNMNNILSIVDTFINLNEPCDCVKAKDFFETWKEQYNNP